MEAIRNAVRGEAERITARGNGTRYGIVTSYDPDNYAVKVTTQPEDRETGWIPVSTPWAGNGWGLFAPPVLGAQVKLEHQEDGTETALCDGMAYNDEDRPVVEGLGGTPSGEFWLVHGSGTRLRFLNDNTFEVNHASLGRFRMLPDSTIEMVHTQEGRVRLLPDTTVEVAHRDGGYLKLAPDGGVHVFHKSGAHLSLLPDTSVVLTQVLGAALRLLANGEVQLTAPGGGMRLIMSGDGTVDLRGARVHAGGEGNVLRVVTELFQSVFNQHVHPLPGGGTTGLPTPPMADGHLTGGFKAN